jgi:hypothetical protein
MALRSKLLCSICSYSILLIVWSKLGLCQTLQPQDAPAAEQSPDNHTGDFILRVTAREVVVDVVALDRHQRPVKDLNESDFSVYEIGKRSKKIPVRISSARIVDPALQDAQADQPSGGFHIALSGTCAIATRFHYRITYQPSPEGWASGYHELLIRANRPDVALSYRHQYYVGEMNVSEKPRIRGNSSSDAEELRRAACFHSETPPSIALNAHLIQTKSTDPLRYELVILSDSLAFTSMPDKLRRVQLDYGACTFSKEGKPLQYLHTSAEQILSLKDYEQVLAKGYSNLLELPRTGDPAVARIVVRDRETENVGSIDVSTAISAPIQLTKTELKAAQAKNAIHGTFGSVVREADCLCGDVYELPTGTRNLPDFGSMESIGALYTHSLNVPYEFVPDGLPGITSRPEWFGIDYFGEFWITVPGLYHFKIASDDGSELWIDDKEIADLDGVHTKLGDSATVMLGEGLHTIHVPYFQETVHVALILQIKVPGADFKVFDLQDFTKPATPN